jgi:6-pyruvoyltetrahydropterin/6-carboxytetrahydropterin synthase
MFITRKAEFSASHVCRNDHWSDEENRRVYGDASGRNGHGHNYVVEVTLEGDPDPTTGMVVDLKEVKDILKREVVDPMDHRSLNFEVQPFDKVVPTAENIALEIWRRLANGFQSLPSKLYRVRLYETADLYVDVTEDDVNSKQLQR